MTGRKLYEYRFIRPMKDSIKWITNVTLVLTSRTVGINTYGIVSTRRQYSDNAFDTIVYYLRDNSDWISMGDIVI
jgi:hypothetical protein